MNGQRWSHHFLSGYLDFDLIAQVLVANCQGVGRTISEQGNFAGDKWLTENRMFPEFRPYVLLEWRLFR